MLNLARIKLDKVAVLLVVTVLVLSACAPAATPAPPTAAPTDAPAPKTAAAQPQAVTLQMAQNDELGSFLADGDGRTLYLFTKDTANTTVCYDECAAAWPPLLTLGEPTLNAGVTAEVIGTTERNDGTTQLTYNGWPLYYFAKDEAPGDTTGQAVGDVWWVVSGEGNPIKPAGLQIAQNDALGSFLADGEGRTLYLFTKDTKDTTVCYDKCEQAWPPLLSLGEPTLSEGIITTLVGTTLREDGTTQLTYNGWPLYYFAQDAAAGDTTGQAVGDVWWVVSGEGNPIKPAGLQVTENEALGSFLADGAGRTLYLFTKDTADTTVCYDQCEQAWPPLLTLGEPMLGDGIDASLLGTTVRKDGTSQVTYNGWPLYYYAEDVAPGDTAGQGVGEVWYVVTPEGVSVQ
jgi:predicted lipoprotein with Yx(FWY)xxD motif